ncbi:phage terminase large subunit [Spiroplasma endosymbiont of Zeiraphera isertana]|uniref:phage terminase large subunit n=1 Tax=Spiroplasma endosymbiont of Zeiraphera isertana TaxID=3066313 RepID=UPI00313E0243
MNKEFTYLHEISYWLLNKSDFTHSEYNLSGSRYSSKTYSIAEELAILIAISIKVNKSIAIYCFRKLNKDINELTKEIDEALINIGFDYKDFTLKYPNKQADFRFKGSKSFIRVMGVYSNSNDRIPLKGLSRSEIKGFDLAIEWCEEANEFSQQEFQAITFALGNAKKTIKIRSCNPDNIYQYFIEYMNKRVPFNLDLMKENNEQIKSIEENQMFKLFHYSNWKLNEQNLKQDKINDLEELKELDPIKAQSWYYGVPSVLTGSIFARYLDKLKTELDFNVNEIVGGLDLGFATSSQAHPTVAVLCFIGENEKTRRIHQESEFYHSNAIMQFKDTYELANNIIDYYLDESIKFQAMKFGFTCYVDYGSGGLAVIDILKKEVEKRKINWLYFTPVDKTTMYLRDRIDWDTICMIKGILSINWKRCPNTHEELSKMQWLAKSKLENSNNEPQMLDLYDNCWDARMYASMHKMKLLINNINNELLINKNKFGEW